MLLRHAASDYRCMLVPVDNNPFSAVEYDAESAEAAIVFAVCALAEIGNAKNNLIGVGEVCKRYLFVRAVSCEKNICRLNSISMASGSNHLTPN